LAQQQALLQVGDPVGRMAPFAGSSAPTGWLICDGAAVSRTQYPQLFAAIGISYGAGNGSSTFALPNARGRVLVGRDAGQTEFDTLGETGGAKTHTLTVDEMPAHRHELAIDSQNAVVSSTTGSGFLKANGAILGRIGSAIVPRSLTSAISAVGADQPHNNLQPYLVTQFIIRAG
jgi:microcystin-dependent protein